MSPLRSIQPIFCLAAGLTLTFACQIQDGGLAKEGVDNIDGERPPPSGGASGGRTGSTPPTAGSGGRSQTPTASAGSGGSAPDAGSPTTMPPADSGAPDDASVASDAAPVFPPEMGPSVACAELPALPRPFVDLGRGPRSDDMAFDGSGNLVSFDDRDVVRLGRDLSRGVIARGVIGPRGGTLRVTPEGQIVVADFIGDALFLLSYDGQRVSQNQAVSRPMKMVWGPGGQLFVSERTGTIARIDVTTNQIVRSTRLPFRPGGLAFSPDRGTLYLGSSDEEGLFELEVGADGELGPPVSIATDLPRIAALATDACGQIYVLSEGDRRVRRWTPAERRWQVVADLGEPYLWSLAFGSGQGGWSKTALYVQDAAGGRLFEIDLGVGVGGPSPPPVP